MSKEVNPITRLKSSFTYIKENEQVENVTLLNKRKEKVFYPDHYGSAPIVKKAINDDFVMILKIKDKKETFGITINYEGKSLDQVELQIGTSYMQGGERFLTLSEKIIGMENVKIAMNGFVKNSKENPEVGLVDLVEEHFGIKLSPENEKNRSYVRKENEERIARKKELIKNKSQLDFEIKASKSMLPQEIAETEEAKAVQRLKKELAEAESRLNQKRIEIQKPIIEMEHKSANMTAQVNKIDREMNQRATSTNVEESTYSKNKTSVKRKPRM